MCDCAEEQERREREAAEAEALLKAEAAARAAEEAAAARARAAASRRPPSESWFSWLKKMFSGSNKPPPRKGAGSTSRASEPGRGPWYWMAVLLGTFTLYFCLASAYCAIKNDWELWKCRLLQARDYMLNPCRQIEDLRALFSELYVMITCNLSKLYTFMVNTIGPLAELIRYHVCQMLQLAIRLVRCIQHALGNLCAEKDAPKKSCRPKPPPPDSCANKK